MDNVMKWFILLLIIIGDPMAILMIIIFNKIINGDAANEPVSEPVSELVSELVDEGVSEGVNEGVKIDEETDEINLVYDVPIIEEDYILTYKSEEPKQVDRTIKLEDLPEKNRGFSVNIPDRKSNNAVERIGSNKELRGDEPGKVFFKKR